MQRKLSLTFRNIILSRWFICVLALLTLAVWISSQMRETYHVSLNGENIGTASTPDLVQDWVNAQKLEFEKQYPGVIYTSNEFVVASERKFKSKADDKKVMDEINKRFTIESYGTRLIVDGKEVGVVKNKQVAQNVLNRIESQYVKRKSKLEVTALSYKADNQTKPKLQSVQFVEPIAFETTSVDPNLLLSEDKLANILQGGNEKAITYTVREGDCISCIAQKFSVSQKVILANNPWIENDFINIGDKLDLTVKRPKLSVKSEERSTETVSIPSGVEISYDENMRKGTSKILNPGKPGKKKLIYNTIKINGELIDEVLIAAEVVTKPIAKQVIQGSKVIRGLGTGSFAWPIDGPQITSEYGRRWGRLHEGIDTVSSDRSIFAADNGRIIYASRNSGYGNHIIIDHQNGYQTLYAHLSKIKVKKGDLVEKGDLIGIMGSTGRSTGVHLHFEIEKNDSQQNPMKYLD